MGKIANCQSLAIFDRRFNRSCFRSFDFESPIARFESQFQITGVFGATNRAFLNR